MSFLNNLAASFSFFVDLGQQVFNIKALNLLFFLSHLLVAKKALNLLLNVCGRKAGEKFWRDENILFFLHVTKKALNLLLAVYSKNGKFPFFPFCLVVVFGQELCLKNFSSCGIGPSRSRSRGAKVAFCFFSLVYFVHKCICFLIGPQRMTFIRPWLELHGVV